MGSFISALEECGADRIGVEEGSTVMVNVISQPEIQSKLWIEIRNVVGSDQQIQQEDHLSWNRSVVALCSTESVRRRPVLRGISPPSPCAPQNHPSSP
jgi:hypothetical protein